MSRLRWPTQPGIARSHNQRLATLERKGNPLVSALRKTIVFSFAGALAVSTSPRYYFGEGAHLVRFVASLGTAGTSNTVLTVYRNGVSIGTITLASGVNFISVPFDHTFGADQDYLTVAVTTAGAGAKDLTLEGRTVA